jgi:hypothetical protein
MRGSSRTAVTRTCICPTGRHAPPHIYCAQDYQTRTVLATARGGVRKRSVAQRASGAPTMAWQRSLLRARSALLDEREARPALLKWRPEMGRNTHMLKLPDPMVPDIPVLIHLLYLSA